MEKVGRPRKFGEPTRNVTLSRIPTKLFGQFKTACMSQNVTMSDVIFDLMREYVSKGSVRDAVHRRAEEMKQI